jgi:group I intron endonuclease
MGYIYRITNLITKMIYIGQTKKDPNERWRGHKSTIKCGKGCPILRNAVHKYGIENFKFEVLIICFDEDLCNYEKQYIKKYNSITPNGYNANEGGEVGGMFKGKHHSEETKKVLSEKSRGRYTNDQVRQEHGESVKKALQTSEKWKKAIAEGRVGKSGGAAKKKLGTKTSEETKKKISESVKKYFSGDSEKNKESHYKHHSEIMTNAIGRKVTQYTLKGEFIKEYPCIAEAARQTNVTRRNIQNNVVNRSKTAGGFVWKYAEIST